ncbi:hypothetical protein IF1G_02273 [Cordyceps javanica]|uniref:Uncharacterized protein n=1 Tax=Cordyceps javanica TaxID=43265 RepID=A0A545VEC5_9HYPO|nr:hypothetical protein IF1G_02273 [Cordyceps javanica]
MKRCELHQGVGVGVAKRYMMTPMYRCSYHDRGRRCKVMHGKVDPSSGLLSKRTRRIFCESRRQLRGLMLPVHRNSPAIVQKPEMAGEVLL